MRAAEALDRLCADGASDPAAPRVLLVAAHPDDETIGAGGRLARLQGSCVVVHVTDGAPVDTRFCSPRAAGLSREAYARMRSAEALQAMSLTGREPPRLVGLGVPDLEASFLMVELVEKLAALWSELDPDMVVTHPYEGGHPDHDATALAVHAAALVAGGSVRSTRAPVIEMTSYHDRDGRTVRGEFLPPPSSDERPPERAALLGPDEQRRKRAMLAAFASQREVLAPFAVDRERFRGAPRYRFGQAPHAGLLHYERSGFPLSGERWRALALAATRSLGFGEGPL